jgi:hypothetical protein
MSPISGGDRLSGVRFGSRAALNAHYERSALVSQWSLGPAHIKDMDREPTHNVFKASDSTKLAQLPRTGGGTSA